jgi:hypothetical protein
MRRMDKMRMEIRDWEIGRFNLLISQSPNLPTPRPKIMAMMGTSGRR